MESPNKWMVLRGIASHSAPEISHALLKYFLNELQMWFGVCFLLVILVFSLFPLSLLQQASIHNLDLIKNRDIVWEHTRKQVKTVREFDEGSILSEMYEIIFQVFC